MITVICGWSRLPNRTAAANFPQVLTGQRGHVYKPLQVTLSASRSFLLLCILTHAVDHVHVACSEI